MLPSVDEIIPVVRDLRDFVLDPAPRANITVKNKNDFVTAADLGVQQRLRSVLQQRYPNVCFMGEEDSDHTVDAEKPTWVLDPIDGTTNYIFNYGLSAISLALLHKGEVLLGVVYNPHTDELFSAERGKGAFLNGQPIHVTQADSPADTLAAVGTMPYDKSKADELFAIARSLFLSCIDIRRSGSAAIDLCYVACGRVGLYAERRLGLWDYAASSLILEEAGGRLTDWQGKAIPMTGRADLAASNGHLHAFLLNTLKDASQA